MAKWDLGKVKTLDETQLGEIESITKRIRRKAEIMRLDQKSAGSVRMHDSNEILTLLDILDRKLGFDK